MRGVTCTLCLSSFLFIDGDALAAVRYVNSNNPSPVPPYTNWTTAATGIQEAVDAADPGDVVVVTNGVYAAGGRIAYGTLTNRVSVDKAITVMSVNGPNATVIEGYQIPGITNGDAAIRCVYLTNGASLLGFTLRKGATRTTEGFTDKSATGGGVMAEFSGVSVVSNCVITGNAAYDNGGGAGGGARLYNCAISNNWSGISGGGIYVPSAVGCTVAANSSTDGGGAYEGFLTNCIVSRNSARVPGAGTGGGASGNCVLYDCVVWGNSAAIHGGGIYSGAIYNCTVVSNSAPSGGDGGGGLYDTIPARNSIIYYNDSNNGYNSINSVPENCCTTPLLRGDDVRNFTNAPLFVNLAAGNLRLQSNSPCINSGFNSAAGTSVDLDGNPRIAGGTVDVGAYEYQSPVSLISYAYLQRYGLPTDGSADYLDSDGDGMNNWMEWQAGTNPTNAQSMLHLETLAKTGSLWKVQWKGIVGRAYFIEKSTNLANSTGFQTLNTTPFTDVNVNDELVSYTDSSGTSAPAFYRLRVSSY